MKTYVCFVEKKVILGFLRQGKSMCLTYTTCATFDLATGIIFQAATIEIELPL